MKVGTLSYATARGLGHLAHDFYLHKVITDVCVVRHNRVPMQDDWYPGAPIAELGQVWHRRAPDLVYDFCKGKDAMIFFETPFDWGLMDYCREIGVRTYLVPMYECTPKDHRPPHHYICPSQLDYQYFFGTVGHWRPCTLLPLPTEYLWRLRERALHFVHNGGYLGVQTRQGKVRREGTTTLIEAMRYVKSPIRLTIRVQENVPSAHVYTCENDPRIEYIAESVPYEELYATGDVAVGAQRWNGCSLPLQEAFVSGMLVMNTDRFPMNTWLPTEPLVPVRRVLENSSIGGNFLPFDEADVHPEDLARTIDNWFDRDITEFSRRGKEWAKLHSWDVLGPKWREALTC